MNALCRVPLFARGLLVLQQPLTDQIPLIVYLRCRSGTTQPILPRSEILKRFAHGLAGVVSSLGFCGWTSLFASADVGYTQYRPP